MNIEALALEQIELYPEFVDTEKIQAALDKFIMQITELFEYIKEACTHAIEAITNFWKVAVKPTIAKLWCYYTLMNWGVKPEIAFKIATKFPEKFTKWFYDFHLTR